MKKFVLILLTLVVSVYARESYVIDNNNSNAYFKAKADMLLFVDDEIVGVNHELKGSLNIENNAIKGKIFIDSSAFNSDNGKRDSHITELLNHQNFNDIIITIQKEEMINEQLILTGTLFINGITQKVNIPVKRKTQGNFLTYMGKTIVKYSDFGIETPTVAGGLIKKAKDEIEIGARITFVRSK